MTLEKIKNYALLICVIIIALLFIFKGCNKDVTYKPVTIETVRQDSFRTVIKYHDSTRVHHINKWRNMTRIVDSTVCYTEIVNLIAECDTIIKIDSVQISSLKGLVKLDSNIQVILFKRIRSDSVLITKLNKKVKRNRVLAKVAFVSGLFGGSFVGYKLH